MGTVQEISIQIKVLEKLQDYRNITVLADHSVNNKVSVKLNLGKEIWNMKIRIVPVIVDALETVLKHWNLNWMSWKYEVGLRLQTIMLLGFVNILRKVLEI